MNPLIDKNALFREMEKAQWYNNADRDEVAEELVLNAPIIEIDTDTVSRQAVMHALEKCHKQCCREDDVGDEWIHFETTENEMKCIPSAQPTQCNSSNVLRHPQCAKRTTLGNCDPVGGFCTSVPKEICDAQVHDVLNSSDLISRQETIDAVKDYLDNTQEYWIPALIDGTVDRIRNLPPTPSRQAEPQTTEWLMGGVSYIHEESVYCSKCRWAWSKKEDLDFFKYCPSCGRKILYRGKWRKVSKNESQGGCAV